jgi:isoleucyl-tRNA synthetase
MNNFATSQGESMSAAPELKATLTLPQTAFPMKANLPQNEPLRLARWASLRLYDELRKAGVGRPPYLLHDGPPYANGPLHLGHALNKGLKDFVVKSKTMAGFDTPYVPGFDCHGLPIEIKVDEQLGRKKLELPTAEVLDACRAYAQKYVDLQTSQFERLGCFGRWDDPYKTMSRAYEARTLEAFYGFLEKGFVYRGLKPVYWCVHDRTALAEAEVEYENHTSPSVYVRYEMLDDRATQDEQINRLLAGYRVWTIIWTTTPWTLPASLAVAFHPDFEYVALKSGSDVYIVAEALAERVKAECKLDDAVVIERFKGSKLDRVHFKHPFLDREILGVNADYVTADTGTGAVHTAPSHGADDFYTGQRYGLDPTCRVDAGGFIHVDPAAWHHPEPPPFENKKIWAANPIIIEMLQASGALLASAPLSHSYPHCWRCHKPVIFRATEQWFIALDTPISDAAGAATTFRNQAIAEIDKVVWDPAWGKERITNMIATRPDWCISRQRIWGVPIAVFMCEKCNKPIMDSDLNKKITALIERDGIEAWYTEAADSLLTDSLKASHEAECVPGATFRKETDILDVWFDSGVSWLAVCESDPELSAAYKSFQNGDGTQCLYLEGGDQHRGWFHSSLLTSVALRGRAPYSNVATAGWTLDEQGRAMSKSLGNGVDPVDIAKRLGGEIVRLWVASIDFREDMAASENLMQRCADIYRKLRNTFRILLGNLHGFDPVRDQVPEAELLQLDRYMLARTRELTEKVRGWYTAFEFHRVYHAVNEFCIVDLSSFYIDVLKDRMYTFAPTSHARRSAQTALWRITETLVRLVAPILSFTSDEVWEYLPHVEGREVSVHLAQFPKPEEVLSEEPGPIIEDWKQLLMVRDFAFVHLEGHRQAKIIGKGLEAELKVLADGSLLDLLQRHKTDLKELFNVSAVEVVEGASRLAVTSVDAGNSTNTLHFDVEVFPASGHKCARCWNFMPHVSSYGIWENVCDRCQSALTEMGIAPPQADSGEAA